MSVDINSLLGSAQALKFAKVDYDFDRDDGAIGTIDLSGDVLPAGALVFACVYRPTTPLVQAGTPNIYVHPTNGIPFFSFNTDTLSTAVMNGGPLTEVALVPRAILMDIAEAEITAGAFTLWLLYADTLG